MSGSVTYEFTDATIIEASKLNQNFSDVLSALDSLTNANLSGSAGITNANLANCKYECLVCLQAGGALIEDRSAGEYVALAPLPYDSASTAAYTVEAVEWVVYDSDGDNANTKTFKLWFGDPTGGAGAPTAIGDAAGFTSTASTTTGGAFTTGMGTATVTPGPTPLANCFMLELDAEAGAGWTAADNVCVTIRLSRSLRS